MQDKNGKANILKIISLSVVIMLAFTGYLVATDLNSRSRDDLIEKDLSDHILLAERTFNKYAIEQKTANTKIMVALKGMAKDIQYMRDK